MKRLWWLVVVGLFFSMAVYGAIPLNKPIPANQVIPTLETSLQKLAQQPPMQAQAFASSLGMKWREGRVRVVVETNGPISEAAIVGIGGEVISRADYLHLVQVDAPPSELIALAHLSGVRFVRRPYRPVPTSISEGVQITGASAWHSAGIRGQGIKVAVIDGGFDGLSAAVAAGAVGNVVYTHDYTGDGLETGGVHGTACAEIVHDMAPDAQLLLMKIGDEVDLANAVDDAITQGANVISHSMGWFNTNFYDGTGPIPGIARRAVNRGIIWVNSAGNSANGGHWEGNWSDVDGDGWLEFSGSDEVNDFELDAGKTVTLYLTWDAWPQTDQDYDLYLVDASGNVVAASEEWQTGTQAPSEQLSYTAPISGWYGVAIYAYSASPHPRLELFTIPYNLGLEYSLPASSIPAPANAAEAFTVGAIDWQDWLTGPQEAFSSQGPTNASQYARSIIKPDICGPDGTGSFTNNGKFYGTSASAPHVAGAAALVWSAHRSWNENTVRQYLENHAIDMGPAGKDNFYGYGRLNLPPPPQKTLQSIAAAPTSVSLNIGGTKQLTVTASYSDGSTADVTSKATYTSSDTSVATVSSSGLITAVAAGSATITASYAEGGVTRQATVSVSVYAPQKTLQSIAVSPTSVSLNIGGTKQLTVTASYSDGSTADVTSKATYTSSDTSVATVSGSGLITAVAAGSATITVSYTEGSVTKQATVSASVGGSEVTVSIGTPGNVAAGSDFTVKVNISQVSNFDSCQYDVIFNPTVLRLDDATKGQIGSKEVPVDIHHKIRSGTWRIVQNIPGMDGVSGSGYLAVLHFHVIGKDGDTSRIDLSNGVLSDNQAQQIQATWIGGSVTVTKPCTPGDANNDGVVNALDITKVERIIAGLDSQTCGADANQDGSVNALDITKVEMIIAGVGSSSSSLTSAAVTVNIDAPSNVQAGSDFTAKVNISQVSNFDACQYDVTFNPAVLRLDDVTKGQIGSKEVPVDIHHKIRSGTWRIVQNIPGMDGVSGSGYLAVLHFHVIGKDGDTSRIDLSNGVLSDNQAQQIQATWVGGSVQIGAGKTLQSIAVSPTSVSLNIGGTKQLTVTASYSDGSTADVTSKATYTSSDTSIATVSSSGLITAVAAGSATITASYAEGGVTRQATVSVSVYAPQKTLQSIAVFPTSVSLNIGGTKQLTVTASYSDGSTADVTSSASYASSNTSVATVSSSGLITAVAAGSATITVNYTEGTVTKTTTVPVTVGGTTNTQTFYKGWNLLSLPLDPVDPSPSAVFDEVTGTLYLYQYDPNTPGNWDTVANGKLTQVGPLGGYWLWLSATTTVSVTGTPVTGDQTKQLGPKGWQMIGVPYQVAWGNGSGGSISIANGTQTKTLAEAVTAGWIYDTIWAYDTSSKSWVKTRVSEGTTLDPWKGYWIYTYVDNLEISFSETGGPPPPPPPTPSSIPQGLIAPQGNPPIPGPPISFDADKLEFGNYPNPVRDVHTTTFKVMGAMAGFVEAIKVEIYDLSGRLVYSSGEIAGTSLDWDTENDYGEYLANGVYLYKMYAKVAGQWVVSKVKKIAILR